jgi:hypothetical protein
MGLQEILVCARYLTSFHLNILPESYSDWVQRLWSSYINLVKDVYQTWAIPTSKININLRFRGWKLIVIYQKSEGPQDYGAD